MPTIGVAIPIPEPWATQLQDYRRSTGDPQAAVTPAHITLIPPTEVESVESLDSQLRSAAATSERFCVRLRGTGTFRPISPVVFVSLVAGISHCELLVEALHDGPLATDSEFPYHPHVTIAHHVEDQTLDRAFEDLSGFDCEFDVDEFLLYVHDELAGWQPVSAYALPSEARDS